MKGEAIQQRERETVGETANQNKQLMIRGQSTVVPRINGVRRASTARRNQCRAIASQPVAHMLRQAQRIWDDAIKPERQMQTNRSQPSCRVEWWRVDGEQQRTVSYWVTVKSRNRGPKTQSRVFVSSKSKLTRRKRAKKLVQSLRF